MKIYSVILSFGAILGVNANFDYFSYPKCVTMQGTMKDLNTDSFDAKVYVFHQMMINCGGKLGQAEFFAREKGSFYLLVWRPVDRSQLILKLVGKIRLTAVSVGYIQMEFPWADQITVFPKDLLGVGYDSSDSDAIISMETENNTSTPNTNLQLGAVTQADLYGDQLKDGVVLNASEHPLKGVAAIKATIEGCTVDLRLAEGPTVYEGRAEIFVDDVWGTLCDKWFMKGGWPKLFCFELGYPDIEFVKTTTEMGKAQVRDSSNPIHEMNPKCKASQNGTMLGCPEHPKANCTHEDDVYVACLPKYKMVKAAEKPGWNLTKVYEYGHWGDICDEREPSWHLEHKANSWLTAFCKELDYAGLQDVKRVENPLKDPRAFMETPDCGTSLNPTLMRMCPSGPLQNVKCDGKTFTYYVKCETNP